MVAGSGEQSLGGFKSSAGRVGAAVSVHGDSLGKNIGVGCRTLLQGIFLTQGSNSGLLHCRWILYCLSHQGSLRISPNKM